MEHEEECDDQVEQREQSVQPQDSRTMGGGGDGREGGRERGGGGRVKEKRKGVINNYYVYTSGVSLEKLSRAVIL